MRLLESEKWRQPPFHFQWVGRVHVVMVMAQSYSELFRFDVPICVSAFRSASIHAFAPNGLPKRYRLEDEMGYICFTVNIAE